MKIFFWLLVILAGCLYAGSVGCATSLHSSDPAGNGLTFSFGVLMTGALWILLAGIVLIAAIGGEMPGIGSVAACVLVPLSGAAAIAAFNLLNQSSALHWPAAIVIVIPLLLLV